MIINTKWLLEYLDPQCTHEAILDALPKVGLEIEAAYALREELAAVRIGFVRSKAPLAGADGMYACQIELQRGQTIGVVCASEHEVEVGWGVPVAAAGTKLPTGATVTAGQFHGARSEGMICLDGEMGLLATGSGLQVFRDEATLGQPLPSLIDISEYLVDVSVLPNRPDCLGFIGIAREVAALLGLKLRYPSVASLARESAAAPVPVELREPALCDRYSCQLIRGVKVKPSPHWLKSRLLAIGARPINNVVDVTNYVLYEWGQPLHAFDYDKLKGGAIVVRRMAAGETLELLSKKVIDGKGTPLVIADGQRPVALAGVMGGRETETRHDTVNVLLESAHFDPVNIRETVKKVDIGVTTRGTASSYRFERGTDANTMLAGALERAAVLIVELAGGRLIGPAVDKYPVNKEPRTFRLTSEQVGSYLGMPVGEGTIKSSLRRLEMECDDQLNVKVPTWRVDANDPVVLIEDVARQIGYDKIPQQPTPATPTIGVLCLLDRLRQAVARNLVASGFLEARSPSLEAPDAGVKFGSYANGEPIRVANPLNQDLSVVRGSLLPGLVSSVERNLRRGVTTLRLFEVDRVFWRDGNTPMSRWMVAGAAGGAAEEFAWRTGEFKLDFYDVKGDVENLLESVGVRNIHFRPLSAKPYMPGAAAEIVADETVIGRVGELMKGAVDTGIMSMQHFAFELELEALATWFERVPGAQLLVRTPAVTRDLAFVVSGDAVYAEIEAEIRRAAGPELESLQLMDLYKGAQIPAGHKSLAFHMVLRDAGRAKAGTLTADDASAIVGRVVAGLHDKFGAELRK